MHLRRAIQRLLRLKMESAREGNPARLASETDRVLKRLPKTYQDAAKTLTDHNAIRTVRYANAVVKQKRDGTHPQIVEFYVRLQKELKRRGYPFYAFEFIRSDDRQRTLKARGVSRAGPGQSPHNHGCAVDVIHLARLWDLTTTEWAIIGQIGKEVARKAKIPIVWGGDWKFYDPAHWELEHWRDLVIAKGNIRFRGEELPEDDHTRFGMLELEAQQIRRQRKLAAI